MATNISTMAGLMASLAGKKVTFSRGDKVLGKVVSVSGSEVVVDLSSKAEGVLPKRDFPPQPQSIKVGDQLEAYVVVPENESGQVVLSSFQQAAGQRTVGLRLQKFIAARDRQSPLTGKIVEVNKGGLLVEMEGRVRGFVPSSQVSLGNLDKLSAGELIGQEIKVRVMEVDPSNNRLVLSARPHISDATKVKLAETQVGEQVKGQIVAVAPFGLFVDLDGLEGIVLAQEISWETPPEVQSLFKVGQEIEAKVISCDENLGRVNLSMRQLSKDPLETLMQQLTVDEVVSGTVKEVTTQGIVVSLENGAEGLVPAAKVDRSFYTIGQTTNFLVDSIDKVRRRISLAPFLTSTKGLIYK